MNAIRVSFDAIRVSPKLRATEDVLVGTPKTGHKNGRFADTVGLASIIQCIEPLDNQAKYSLRRFPAMGCLHISETSVSWLLVIAHPDDECMFFFPVLKALVSRGCNMHILSLSNGGGDGLGKIRTEELSRAATLCCVKTATVIDDFKLPDGMDKQWNPNIVAHCVRSHVEKIPGDVAVVTFDSFGASGHPNHVATSSGVRAMFADAGDVQIAKNLVHYELETVSIPRRFLGPLNMLLVSLRASRDCLIFFNLNVHSAWRAMSMHASQFVWYRKIFILISAYTYCNRCKLISAFSTNGHLGAHERSKPTK